MTQLEELKLKVDSLSMLVAKAGKLLGNLDPALVFANAKIDLAMYMLNLSAMDGYIDYNETKLLDALCDVSVSREEMVAMAKKYKLPSAELLTTVPESFKILCEMDKQLIKIGEEAGGSRMMIAIYTEVGAALSVIDGNVDDNEILSHKAFLTVLLDYASKNI